MNPFDFLLLAVIALAVLLAARRVYKNKKRGCSCGCADCGACAACRGDAKRDGGCARERSGS